MTSEEPETVVELDGVTKTFGSLVAVDDIDLSVKQGEILTLLGPSGCGKTTSLRMIAGFETPTSGAVRINGRNVSDIPPYRRDTGMVFQRYALFKHMTVADNIAFGLKMDGRPDDEVNERVQEMLSMVQLDGMGDRYPTKLSGGQQQRVALARSLASEPAVLLMDEPLSNLDKKLREEMQLEFLRLHEALDVTMVYVTHNQSEALTLSDRMAVMSDGEIRQVGSPREVYQNPADQFVADFIGQANILTGTVSERTETGYRLDLDIGTTVTLTEKTVPDDRGLSTGDRIDVVFRPERLKMRAGTDTDENTLNGTISEITYLGSTTEYYVNVGDEQIHVQQHGVETDHDERNGDSVSISFDPSTPVAIPSREA